MIRRRVLVSGRVQGVFFRDTCRRVAEAAGVAGWARNMPDGRVEVVLEGERDAVQSVVDWCRRGTDWAQVTSVEVIEEEPRGETGFRIR
ncbi:MAG: acylphosphatase [Actinomycetota bacterium]